MTFDEAVDAAHSFADTHLDEYGYTDEKAARITMEKEAMLAAFATMKAQRNALLAVVRDVEWGTEWTMPPFERQVEVCPSCHYEMQHAADCALAAALKMEAP